MNAATLIDGLEAAGICIRTDSDDLLVTIHPGGTLAPYRERIRQHKPAILAELRLRKRIVAAATADPADFDRDAYDALWQEWHEAQEHAP